MASDNRSAGDIDKLLGQRLRARRLQEHMSQERLAEALGVTFQQIQKYEKGVNRMAASRLLAVARIFGLPVSVFFEGLGADEADRRSDLPAIESVLATDEGQELLGLLAKMPSQSVRRRFLALARVLAAEDAALN